AGVIVLASSLPACASSLSAGGPSRMRSAKVPSLILSTAPPVPSTVMVTLWPLACSKPGMSPFMICSTAPVVMRTTSAALVAGAANSTPKQPAVAAAVNFNHVRMASSLSDARIAECQYRRIETSGRPTRRSVRRLHALLLVRGHGSLRRDESHHRLGDLHFLGLGRDADRIFDDPVDVHRQRTDQRHAGHR